MKKIIAIVVCAYALIFVGYRYYHLLKPPADDTPASSDTASQPPAKVQLVRRLDVDAMAARMKDHQDLYKKLRDASLKVYAKRRAPGKFDDVDAEEMRLAAYLWVWDDYYEEGLWQTVADNSQTERRMPVDQRDLLVNCMESVGHYSIFYDTNDDNDSVNRALADRIDASDYPVEFKMWAWLHFAHTISRGSGDPEVSPHIPRGIAMLPELVTKTAQCYRELIKEKLPDDILYAKGAKCMDWVSDNAQALVQMAAELDKAFQAEAPDDPVRMVLQGKYYTIYAWNARGSGYADTVTEEGNRLMQERLAKSAEILEAAYKKYPDNAAIISADMMRVELGQGEGTPRMEAWFQRAIQAEPDNYYTYETKAYYLLPRWYGTPEQSWQFGLDCVKTQNWRAKLPMILVYAADDFANTGNSSVFEMPAVWNPLEKVFRDWLERYPESAIFRSKFAKYAAMGKHWDVAKEQFAALGDNWDRQVFRGVDYQAMKNKADEETKGK